MTISISNLEAIGRAVSAALNKKHDALKDVVDEQRALIKSRTQRGIDIEGRKFRKYSKSWARRRQLHKPPRPVSPVDLTFDDIMLKNMRTIVARAGGISTATIDFRDPEQAVKAKGNEQLGKRKFFGITRRGVEEMKKKLREIK